jgi:hypothetical protein
MKHKRVKSSEAQNFFIFFYIFGLINLIAYCNKPKLTLAMEEGTGKNESVERNNREEVFSKAVRAGKRTYFFDVKATRRNDYYLTVTESKKRLTKEGKQFYEKHKIFLYREDFDKFLEGLNEAFQFIRNAPPVINNEGDDHEDESPSGEYTDVSFEDLESKPNA